MPGKKGKKKHTWSSSLKFSFQIALFCILQDLVLETLPGKFINEEMIGLQAEKLGQVRGAQSDGGHLLRSETHQVYYVQHKEEGLAILCGRFL